MRYRSGFVPSLIFFIILVSALTPRLEAATDSELRKCDALIWSGKYEDAVKALEHLKTERPDDPEVLLRLGISLSMLKRYKSAHEALDAALAAAPDDPRILHNIGLLFLRERKRDEAIKYFKKTLAIRPWHPETNFHLGLIYEARGENEKAKQYYIAELNANGRCAKAWQHLMMLSGENSAWKPISPKAVLIAVVGFVVGLGLLIVHKRSNAKEIVCEE